MKTIPWTTISFLSDGGARCLEEAVGTVMCVDFFGYAAGAFQLVAFFAVEEMFRGIEGEGRARFVWVECCFLFVVEVGG
jgi:hypothetical protein